MADFNIDELTEDLSPALADYIMTSDQSAGPATRKATLASVPIVNGQGAVAPLAADSLVIYDASVGGNAKATIAEVLALAGVGTAAAFDELAVTAAIETVLADLITFVPILGTMALSGIGASFDMPSNGQLRYIGAATRSFQITCTLSMISPSNNQLTEMAVLKNGVVHTRSEIQRKVGTGSDAGAAPVQALVQLATNDYVELGIRNTTSTANVTATKANMIAHAL